MNVRITVTEGPYHGTSYSGPLSDAPVTVLVPEGIDSRRTELQANEIRADVASELATRARVVIATTSWRIEVERLDGEPA